MRDDDHQGGFYMSLSGNTEVSKSIHQFNFLIEFIHSNTKKSPFPIFY